MQGERLKLCRRQMLSEFLLKNCSWEVRMEGCEAVRHLDFEAEVNSFRPCYHNSSLRDEFSVSEYSLKSDQ